METTETLRRKISSAEDLQSVVKTMKALAALSIRQFERAVESLADYHRTVELGLHIVVRKKPELLGALNSPASTRFLAIVFGSDHGMAGQFNDLIVSHVLREMDELQPEAEAWQVWIVGERVRSRMERMDSPGSQFFAVPPSVAGITGTVQEMLPAIEAARRESRVENIVLFYNRLLSGSSFRPHTVPLLPIDLERLRRLAKEPWPTRVLPTFTMEPERLFSALLRQFLFVCLYRALAESLASENASRLTSMQVAEKNIEERLNELRARYHQQRQSTITEELMDIVSGFEALTNRGT